VPDKGKANTAAIALLARTLRVPKSAITLVAGASARLKTVRIDADFDQSLLSGDDQGR
jgi:uncharacterized protein YggU (UPF0235/DUF167 family)